MKLMHLLLLFCGFFLLSCMAKSSPTDPEINSQQAFGVIQHSSGFRLSLVMEEDNLIVSFGHPWFCKGEKEGDSLSLRINNQDCSQYRQTNQWVIPKKYHAGQRIEVKFYAKGDAYNNGPFEITFNDHIILAYPIIMLNDTAPDSIGSSYKLQWRCQNANQNLIVYATSFETGFTGGAPGVDFYQELSGNPSEYSFPAGTLVLDTEYSYYFAYGVSSFNYIYDSKNKLLVYSGDDQRMDKYVNIEQ